MQEKTSWSRRRILTAAGLSLPSVALARVVHRSDIGLASEGARPVEEVHPMQIRRSSERGYADHGWLRSFHTFSFAGYFDPSHMGFQSLRVINEDRVAPGQGFGTHPHQNMEIISYVLEGQLKHKDSMGTGSVVRPGEVQRMSAGTGVYHSEFNGSQDELVHFLQIWIVPDRKGYEPSYEQKEFPTEQRRGRLRLVASRDGRDGSVTVHQDVSLYAGLFSHGEEAKFEVASGRSAWVHVARGSVTLNGTLLEAGDAAAIREPGTLALVGEDDGEVLLFDLASNAAA
jgi:redox-sensitive bicupin YhaK (pirin superfamily)